MIQTGKQYPLSAMGYDMVHMWNAHGGDIQTRGLNKVTVVEKTPGNQMISIEFPDGNILSGVPSKALLDD